MKHTLRNIFLITIALGLFFTSGIFLWVATLEIPTLDGFATRTITQSTKIYDRTGEILLFDLHEDIRRTVVPLDEMSRHLKNATIAIEDAEFYNHNGVRPLRTLKAVFDNITTGNLLGGQGGSTITQQVIKNTLLTREKKISRKVKEWILALKIERILDKDEILELYLNEAPYGGNIYGAEEASRHFYAKSSYEITLAEAAYLAALPQAPSRYSPYGNNIDLLDARKDRVLEQMLLGGFIDDIEYEEALMEKVEFEQYGDTNIKAPHFVFYIREYIEEKYGREAVYESGLKVITTLDYELQKIGEEVVAEYAYSNEEKFNAENAALVAIDPKTGQILTMVGSRDYFDENIDGKFNVSTAKNRQPGSTFKPIVYATAFERGYTPETVVFDVPTQFSTNCEPDDFTMNDGCFSPGNYDGEFRGPMTLRDALAQSINIPAVKALYLAGIGNSINTAEKLGITSLTEAPSHYGLSLVLGAGEVSLLEITGAYATFANNGIRQEKTGILSIEDSAGTILEEYEVTDGEQVITEQAARSITSILTDIQARIPAYGENSFSFGEQQVAIKTGTTNDFRDVWIMGYTPTIAVGTWGGNNDNSPIVKKVAGFVLAPMWRAYMDRALLIVPAENFEAPLPEESPETIKPVLRGFWQGSTVSTSASIHSILHWVIKEDPRGTIPGIPSADSQYSLWEYAVRLWARDNAPQLLGAEGFVEIITIPQTPIRISNPINNSFYAPGEKVVITVSVPHNLPVTSVEYLINNTSVGSSVISPFTFALIPTQTGVHSVKAVARGSFAGTSESQVTFEVK